ncbi:hypothetical protein NDU88_003497 [Pleurodeles waltl]|uniref:Reverse transcriptase domain-containing protein n=1 Tax=Pleurodeles waltl TaxID=8319 RepID=A0AAV7M3J9_PLEWA|nr:hypothetical protein NDU88_003497 [Pleurodeles waltl]
MVLSLDAKKAFNAVNRQYMRQVLERLGFKPKLMGWVTLVYTDSVATELGLSGSLTGESTVTSSWLQLLLLGQDSTLGLIFNVSGLTFDLEVDLFALHLVTSIALEAYLPFAGLSQ